MTNVFKMEQNASFYINSAKEYIEKGDSENAVIYIRKALELEKKSGYFIMLGKEYGKLGEDDFATYNFLKALNTDPVAAFSALIGNAYESGNLGAVVYYMSLMLEAVPNGEASVYINSDLFDLATEISEETLNNLAESQSVLSYVESRFTPENRAFLKGKILYDKGNLLEAREEFFKVSKENQNYEEARKLLSEIALLKNDYPTAYIIAEELYKESKSQGISDFLSLSLLSQDVTLFNRAVGYLFDLDPEDDDYIDLIERAFYIATHFELFYIADKLLKILINEYPLDSEFLLIEATYFFNRGNKTEALKKVKRVFNIFGPQSSAPFVEKLIKSTTDKELPYVGSKAYIELCVIPLLKELAGTSKAEIKNAFFNSSLVMCLNELLKYSPEWSSYPARLAELSLKEINAYLVSLLASPFVYDEVKADIFVELVKNGLRGTYLILFDGKLLGGEILVPEEFNDAGNLFKSAYANVVLRLYEIDRGIDFKRLYVAVKTILPLSRAKSETALCAVLLKTYMGVDITDNDALDAFSASKATYKSYLEQLKN